MALGLEEERIERLLGGESQAVVDQFRPPWLQAELLVVEVALEGEVLEVSMGQEQSQAPDISRSHGS